MSSYHNQHEWTDQVLADLERGEQLDISGPPESLVGFEGADGLPIIGLPLVLKICALGGFPASFVSDHAPSALGNLNLAPEFASAGPYASSGPSFTDYCFGHNVECPQPEGTCATAWDSTRDGSVSTLMGMDIALEYGLVLPMGVGMDMEMSTDVSPYLPSAYVLQEMGLYGMNSLGYVDPVDTLLPDHGMFARQALQPTVMNDMDFPGYTDSVETFLPAHGASAYQGFLPKGSSPALVAGSIAMPVAEMNNFMLAAPNPAFPVQVHVQGQHNCTQVPCGRSFKRDSDRRRHEIGVHGVNRPLYLCPVHGCTRSVGAGYSRSDKLIEHKWRKHANLGYIRRV